MTDAVFDSILQQQKRGPKPGTPSPRKGKVYAEPSAGRTVTLPVSVWQDVAALAQAQGISSNHAVKQAVQQWLASEAGRQ